MDKFDTLAKLPAKIYDTELTFTIKKFNKKNSPNLGEFFY